jgi:outer membrane immunogenic protein
VLLFGTGGVAFTHVESSATCGAVAFPVGWCSLGGPFLNTTQTRSADRIGWTVGGGIEAMLSPNWLVRGEYRYADYGKFASTVFTGSNGAVVNGDAIAYDTALRTHTVTVGIAYKFGGPVVAKY